MKKRIFRFAAALLLAAVLLPAAPVRADGGISTPQTVQPGISGSGLKSGALDAPELTRGEIAALLKDAPVTLSSAVQRFEEEPSCTAPYAAGKVGAAVLNAAVKRLNALRTLAGLPAVTADEALNENAQYGAVLLGAVGDLNHAPARPDGMEEDFYRQGLSAVSSSNTYMTTDGLPAGAVDAFMDDSDAGNLSCLGHRRWQLNPSLGKVGFGYAVGSVSAFDGRPLKYVTEKVFDLSGGAVDYNFVSWPASGYFPSEQFGRDCCWSVTLNPEVYAQPSLSDVSVTLIRESDGAVWTFSGEETYTPADSGSYFNVDTNGYGVNNCIIFRPEGIRTYAGLYTVRIDGLKDREGRSLPLFSYQTYFFNAANYREEAPSDWAAEEVSAAVEEGLAPLDLRDDWRSSITRQDFCRLMIALVERRTGQDIDSYLAAKGLTVTDPFTDTDNGDVLAAYALGIVNGVSAGQFVPGGSITRQEAAAMLARTARVLGLNAAAGASFTDAGQAAPWAAGEIAFVSGLTDPATGKAVMEGMGDGRFDPLGAYTREQALMTALRLFHCK